LRARTDGERGHAPPRRRRSAVGCCARHSTCSMTCATKWRATCRSPAGAQLLNDVAWLQYRLGDYSSCVDSCSSPPTRSINGTRWWSRRR
jgi:hypothetical protein